MAPEETQRATRMTVEDERTGTATTAPAAPERVISFSSYGLYEEEIPRLFVREDSLSEAWATGRLRSTGR